MTSTAPLDSSVLPEGVRARFVEGINGLRVHLLEAGYDQPGRPCVLLLHGFPELAYSWRKVMVPLAQAGYHVVAPDQRGYGRTTGWDPRYDGDLASFRLLNLARDALGLVFALGHRTVACVTGHDFGSPVAAWCALLRPDVFESAGLMSAPFAGPPALPFDTDRHPAPAPAVPDVHQALAALPRPRKHYQRYYCTPEANAQMWRCEQGVHDFLRAYYHHKSADWPGNKPFRLQGASAAELARMPTYYIMDLYRDMAQTVAPEMPPKPQVAANRWLPDDELRVYSKEFGRTGFQGGLQWYRCALSPAFVAEMQMFAGRTLDVPSVYIAGAADWGVYQLPGAFERMQDAACTRMVGVHLVEGAGHWVQQERPQETARLLLDFLGQARPAGPLSRG